MFSISFMQASKKELFPLPTLPTTTTKLPGSMRVVRFFRIIRLPPCIVASSTFAFGSKIFW